MMLCGMPNPFLWGTIAGLLKLHSLCGPHRDAGPPVAVAVVSFDGLAHGVYVAGSFLGLTIIEGQVIQPLLVGRRLQLESHAGISFPLGLAALFWGIAGIITRETRVGRVESRRQALLGQQAAGRLPQSRRRDSG